MSSHQSVLWRIYPLIKGCPLIRVSYDMGWTVMSSSNPHATTVILIITYEPLGCIITLSADLLYWTHVPLLCNKLYIQKCRRDTGQYLKNSVHLSNINVIYADWTKIKFELQQHYTFLGQTMSWNMKFINTHKCDMYDFHSFIHTYILCIYFTFICIHVWLR